MRFIPKYISDIINRARDVLQRGPKGYVLNPDALVRDDPATEVARQLVGWAERAILVGDELEPTPVGEKKLVRAALDGSGLLHLERGWHAPDQVTANTLREAILALQEGPQIEGDPNQPVPEASKRQALYRAWAEPVRAQLQEVLDGIASARRHPPKDDGKAPATEYVQISPNGQVVGTASDAEVVTYRGHGNPVGHWDIEKRPLTEAQFHSLASLIPSEDCSISGMVTWRRKTARTANSLAERKLLAMNDEEAQPDATRDDSLDRTFTVALTPLGFRYLREHKQQLTQAQRRRLKIHDDVCRWCPEMAAASRRPEASTTQRRVGWDEDGAPVLSGDDRSYFQHDPARASYLAFDDMQVGDVVALSHAEPVRRAEILRTAEPFKERIGGATHAHWGRLLDGSGREGWIPYGPGGVAPVEHRPGHGPVVPRPGLPEPYLYNAQHKREVVDWLAGLDLPELRRRQHLIHAQQRLLHEQVTRLPQKEQDHIKKGASPPHRLDIAGLNLSMIDRLLAAAIDQKEFGAGAVRQGQSVVEDFVHGLQQQVSPAASDKITGFLERHGVELHSRLSEVLSELESQHDAGERRIFKRDVFKRDVVPKTPSVLVFLDEEKLACGVSDAEIKKRAEPIKEPGRRGAWINIPAIGYAIGWSDLRRKAAAIVAKADRLNKLTAELRAVLGGQAATLDASNKLEVAVGLLSRGPVVWSTTPVACAQDGTGAAEATEHKPHSANAGYVDERKSKHPRLPGYFVIYDRNATPPPDIDADDRWIVMLEPGSQMVSVSSLRLARTLMVSMAEGSDEVDFGQWESDGAAVRVPKYVVEILEAAVKRLDEGPGSLDAPPGASELEVSMDWKSWASTWLLGVAISSSSRSGQAAERGIGGAGLRALSDAAGKLRLPLVLATALAGAVTTLSAGPPVRKPARRMTNLARRGMYQAWTRPVRRQLAGVLEGVSAAGAGERR